MDRFTIATKIELITVRFVVVLNKHRKLSPLLLIWIFLLNSCAPEKPVDYGIKNNLLHIGNGVEPEDLDPHIITGMSEFNIVSALFEGLLRVDEKTLEPAAGVAHSWKVSEDGLKYTFYLRKEARWSNGDSLTAKDFVFSIKRILSAELGSSYAFMLYPLKNAKAFNQGKVPFSKVGVICIDEHTLEMHLQQPTPYFLSLLNHPAWYPVHQQNLLSFGSVIQRGTGWTHKNHVGNGAFQLKEWRVSDAVICQKNPFYWGSKSVVLQELHFHAIVNNNTEIRAFYTGQIHATSTVPPNQIPPLLKSKAPELRIAPDLGIYYFILNTEIPGLDRKLVRQALNLATNRLLIADKIRQRGEEPALHFTPPNTGGYYAPDCLEYNPSIARKKLKKAGYPNGKGFPTLTMLYNTSENHKAIAEAIQQMWKSELNINVELKNQEWKIYLDSRKRRDFEICRASWIGDYNDPTTFLNLWLEKSTMNQSAWKNPHYDALIDKASDLNYSKERFTIFAEAEKILMEESPLLPIFFYKRASLQDPRIENWESNILNVRNYRNFSFKSKK